MRRICEIIADAKEGIVPNHEECFWTMLALSGSLHFANGTLVKIAESMNEPNRLSMTAKIHLNSVDKVNKSRFDFMQQDPQKWLGSIGNPFTPESKKFQEWGKKIIERAEQKIKNEKESKNK